jgi:hypothetical protein
MIALVYETRFEATPPQVLVGRIRIVDGRLVGEPPDDPSIALILGQDALRHDTGERVSPTEDPERFLAALPAAYTGAMLRVGLVREDPEGSS